MLVPNTKSRKPSFFIKQVKEIKPLIAGVGASVLYFELPAPSIKIIKAYHWDTSLPAVFYGVRLFLNKFLQFVEIRLQKYRVSLLL